MQPDKSTIRIVAMVLCTLMFVLAWGAPSSRGDEADDLAGKIEKTLSGVNRRIVTDPKRAEKDLLEAMKELGRLKELSAEHKKLPALTKRAGDLEKKLEKRLGRPVGGTGEPEKKKAEPEKKKTPSALPSSVVSRLKKVDAALTATEMALAKNQLQTATRKLGEANKVMGEIRKRYGSKIPAGNPDMKAAEERLDAVSRKVSDAEDAVAKSAAAAADVERQREARSREWIDKFSPFFDYDSDLYLRMGAEFNRATDEEKEKCRRAYARANELMPVYRKTAFPQGKSQELESLAQRLTRYLELYNKDEARARQEESCRAWTDRLRAYVDVGSGSRKQLIASVTLSEEQIKARAALLEEAKEVWVDYGKAEFPLGKTPRLLALEEEMARRLEEMPEALRKSRSLVAGDLETEFERVLNHLNRDTGWKQDPARSPNIAMKRDVEPLRDALQRYAATVGADDARLKTLRDLMKRIERQDGENRAIRAERAFMIPDAYQGADAGDLRTKVKGIVAAKIEKAQILRVTLPAGDWKEESVVEWTDTTRSAVRHRVTQSMTTQAAARGADGKVYLHSVHLARDRRSDGSWGPLYGHIMWSDWMAEKNVGRKALAR